MPGWHRITKDAVGNGQLKVAGIVQEQHPDRAVLYMQWQQMGWPVLADPFNELGIKVVPITLLIDESGVVRYRNPKKADLKTFLATDYPVSAPPETIEPFRETIQSLKERSEDPQSLFQLGVAYRQRFDSEQRQPDNFSKAIDAWKKALSLNPDQYIWRRRIQQYGPRLDKPYSFYDWVTRARKEITARGQIPHQLSAEPNGSEFARPQSGAKAQPSQSKAHPDPEGKVTRDDQSLLNVQTIIVPSTQDSKEAMRVHLHFTPDDARKVHWTNDAGQLSFFPKTDSSFTIHDLTHLEKVPDELTSAETRSIEFEVRPAKGKKLPTSIEGAAFYYVCLGDDGVCQYLRQDITILLK